MRGTRDSSKAIIVAAKAEFDASGFAGARVQAIADTAGVNKQLIFYYHGSKRGLFRDVIRSSLNEIAIATADRDTTPPPTTRLRRRIAALYSALADRPHLWKLLTGDSAVDRESSVLALDAFTVIIEGFAAIITDGQRLGYFRDECDATTSARQALSLVLGHIVIEQGLPQHADGSYGPHVWESISRLLLRSLEW